MLWAILLSFAVAVVVYVYVYVYVYVLFILGVRYNASLRYDKIGIKNEFVNTCISRSLGSNK